MVAVPVSHLKPGVCVLHHVHSPKGGLLLHKNHVITSRDIEVLKAFMIQHVHVKETEKNQKNGIDNTSDWQFATEMVAFFHLYEKLLQVLKNQFRFIQTGRNDLPVIEIRTELTKLFALIDVYNPMTFIPPPQKIFDSFYLNIAIMRCLSSHLIAKIIDMPQKDRIPLAMGALLCDIGVTRFDVSDPEITEEEKVKKLKNHTHIGYEILNENIGMNEGTKLCAWQHHEQVDGKGYPQGLSDAYIHPYAKIVAVVDRFHHKMLPLYEKHQQGSPYVLLESFIDESKGKLDENIVHAFSGYIAQMKEGSTIRLGNGEIGKVVRINSEHITRPDIEVKGKIVRLIEQPTWFIDRVLGEQDAEHLLLS
jgi:hypothetical protein